MRGSNHLRNVLGACWLLGCLGASAGGCGDGEGGAGSPPDGAMAADLSMEVMLDLSAPDLSAPDLVVRDLVMSDLAAPDLATPDLVIRDLAMPDLAQPDFAARDLAMADLAAPPDLTVVDLRSPPDLSVAPDLIVRDLAQPPDLTIRDLAPAPDLVAAGFTWKLIGTLNKYPRDSSGVAFINGSINSPQDNLTWNPMTAVQGTTAIFLGVNFGRRGYACQCLVGGHEYVLGGGGDGVGSPFIEPTYIDVDWNKNTGATLASPLAIHSSACAAANNLCYVIGGSSSGNPPYGTAAARIFDPAKGTFAAGPALPVPTVSAAAATGGGKMLVAGGYCSGGGACPAKNDPSGMDATVLSSVYSADVVNPVWGAEVSLPSPVTGAGMVFLNNRFYLVGGAGSAFGPINPNGVLSFALGDAKWRSDAAAPGTGNTVSVLTDGAVIYAIVYENFVYDLYRGTP